MNDMLRAGLQEVFSRFLTKEERPDGWVRIWSDEKNRVDKLCLFCEDRCVRDVQFTFVFVWEGVWKTIGNCKTELSFHTYTWNAIMRVPDVLD